ERTQEREHPSGHPHQERERHRAARLPHHRAGDDEDPGPDHRADGDRDQLAKPQQPRQLLVLTHDDLPAFPLPLCTADVPAFPPPNRFCHTVSFSILSRSTSTPMPVPAGTAIMPPCMVHSGETTSRSQYRELGEMSPGLVKLGSEARATL